MKTEIKNEKGFGFERIVMKTPNGGDMIETHYYDDNGNRCEIDKATMFSRYELTFDDELLVHSSGIIEHKNDTE